ncbi:MAG: Maf family protein, partial [Thermomicrobiales bacterium]
MTSPRAAATRQIILASASPRRRDLLTRLGLPFTIEPSDDPEEVDPALPPERLVMALAERKARAVAAWHPSALVIGSDTEVALFGKVFGKPRDDADAARMLRDLSGRSHEVWTGIAVIDAESGRVERHAVPSVVRFRPITNDEIAAYVATSEGRDKAGAYAIQGVGAGLIEAIHGCWTNIVGLPLCETADLLRRHGVVIAAPDPICARPDGSPCP